MDYQATIELDGRPLTDAEVDAAIDALPSMSAVLGEHAGRTEVILTLPAVDVVQATTLAAAAVERATGRRVLAASVMPTEEWDRRQGFVPMPEIVGVTEAAQMLGVSRQYVLQLVDEGRLPAQRAGKLLALSRGTVEALAASRAQAAS